MNNLTPAEQLAIEIYYAQSKEVSISVDEWVKKIEDLLAEQEKGFKKILKTKQDHYNLREKLVIEEQKKEIMEKIEGMKESGEENDKSPYDQPQPRAYNKALKDVIKLINIE